MAKPQQLHVVCRGVQVATTTHKFGGNLLATIIGGYKLINFWVGQQ